MKPLEKRLRALESPNAVVMEDWSFTLGDDEEGPLLIEHTMTHDEWILSLGKNQ